MKKEKKESVSGQEADRIRVLEFHQRRFVVGLTWQTIRAQRNPMKEIKSIGKQRNLDLVAVRQSDSIQAGFAPKTRLKLRGAYSLVVTLASLLEGCCIAVVALEGEAPEQQRFTLVGKTERGGIHPFSDEIYTPEELPQVIIDLKDQLRGSKGNLEIPVYGDSAFPWVTAELDLAALLAPQNLSKNFRLKPLTWGMTRKQLMAVSAAAVLLLVGLMVYLHLASLREEQQRKVRIQEIARQEQLNREARYKTALAGFRHPWIEQPSAKTFIRSCQSGIEKIPLSLMGWVPSVVVCGETGTGVQYIRKTNSAVTTRDFVEAVKKAFSVPADFNFENSSQTTFSLPHKLPPEGDDPLEPINIRLMNFISLFQSLNIDLSVSAVPIKDVKKNSQGEDLPLQDWQEYSFSAESDIPPQMIFTGTDYTGIRLSNIHYAINNADGSVRYKISGSLYGKR